MSSKTIDNNGKTKDKPINGPEANSSQQLTEHSDVGQTCRPFVRPLCMPLDVPIGGHSVVHFCRPVDVPYRNLLRRLIRRLLYRLPTGPRLVVEHGEHSALDARSASLTVCSRNRCTRT